VRYVLFLRTDAAGARTMLNGLSVGWDEFGSSLRRFGGELQELHAIAGRFDAIAIVKFGDPAGLLAFSLAATGQGQYVEASPVFDREDISRAETVAREAAEAYRSQAAAALDELAGSEEAK
jgi:uncharacterized protein with GYD domain